MNKVAAESTLPDPFLRSSFHKSMFASVITRAAPLIFVCALLAGQPATQAADIAGAWVSNVKVCNQIFQRKGTRVSLTSRSDTYGSGFVIDGKSIRGKIANCKIKTRKDDGDLVHLIATCASDVMLSDVELTLKILDDNRIARVFAGMPELETPYYRCPR